MRACMLIALLAACQRTAPPSPVPAAPTPAPAPPAPLQTRAPHAPMSQEEMATTDGAIALGHLQSEANAAEALARAEPDITNLGILAALRGELGQTVEAEALFLRAQQSFRDTLPFPLAWLYFQQGLMWENEGRSGRAREFYAAAHERLPA